MKKITLVLAILMMTITSFAIGTPKYVASFTDKVKMKEFIKKSGKEILATGEFKYWNVETTILNETSVSVRVYGTNVALSPEWNGCGGVYYGAVNNTTALFMAADAAYVSYEGQGYNCVCSETYDNYYPGEFPGHQTCVRVTASVSTTCGCLM